MGDETLVLRPARGKPVELATRTVAEGYGVPTQRLFLASPDRRWLSYLDAAGALRVRNARGVEHVIDGVGERDARFSDDSRHLAVFRPAGDGSLALTVIELATGAQRTLATGWYPRWMEWTADGVVVQRQDAATGHTLLELVPIDGEPSRELVSTGGYVERFFAGRRGTRVVWVEGGKVRAVSTRGGAARELGDFAGYPSNGDASPDGRRVALMTRDAVYLIEDDGAPRLVAERLAVPHTIWFSPDGERLAFASLVRATVIERDGKETHLDATDEIQAMRFGRGGDLLVFETGRALAWTPGKATRILTRRLGKAAIHGGDLFDGGLVVWTRTERPRSRAARDGGDGGPVLLVDELGRDLVTGVPVGDRSSAAIVPTR